MRAIHSCTFHSLAQRAYDRAHIHPADVLVRLPHAHKDDWLTRLVHHRERRANLSSTVSNLVRKIPSMYCLRPLRTQRMSTLSCLSSPTETARAQNAPAQAHTCARATRTKPRKDLRSGCDGTHPVMVRPTSLRAWSANAWLNFLS